MRKFVEDEMMMIDRGLLRRVCVILGEEGLAEAELEARIVAIAASPMHARRLIDWTREAFGLVLIRQIAQVVLPTTFQARAEDGNWIEFSLDAEPIFGIAIKEALEMVHSGPRDLFRNIAMRGSMFQAVKKALDAERIVDGAELSGPALLGIPAEVYLRG